jgi:hypothetical protein
MKRILLFLFALISYPMIAQDLPNGLTEQELRMLPTYRFPGKTTRPLQVLRVVPLGLWQNGRGFRTCDFVEEFLRKYFERNSTLGKIGNEGDYYLHRLKCR